MVTTLDGGCYLVNGNTLIPDDEQAKEKLSALGVSDVTKESATQNTIAYGILKQHNTSGNMDKL